MTYSLCLFIQAFHICLVISLPSASGRAFPLLLRLFIRFTSLLVFLQKYEYVHLMPSCANSTFMCYAFVNHLIKKLLTSDYNNVSKTG